MRSDAGKGDSVPPGSGIDSSVPHSARFWNYLLGGKDNYPADREVGDYIKANLPVLVDVARTSRAFLGRTVRYLVETEGIRQFLDVGTGLPTADNTHEVAQRIAPESRIVYVDNDPLVLSHARALLTSTPEGVTDYIHADVRDPATILSAAGNTLDFGRPIALMLLGIMGHIEDFAEVKALIGRFMDALPSGSFLVHLEGTDTSPEMVEAQEQYKASGAVPYFVRSPDQMRSAFEGLDLVEPGVVPVTQWKPDLGPTSGPADVPVYGGVGRKP